MAVAVAAVACTGEVTGDSGAVDSDAVAGADAWVDAGVVVEPDAGGHPDAGPQTLIASEAGCFLDVVDTDSRYEQVIGEAGTE